jgi:hypothetical protein
LVRPGSGIGGCGKWQLDAPETIVDAIAPAGTLWVNAIRMTVNPARGSLVVTCDASTSNVGAIGRMAAGRSSSLCRC